jgi:hypothetical protein
MPGNNELRYSAKQQLSTARLEVGIVFVPNTRPTLPNSDLTKWQSLAVASIDNFVKLFVKLLNRALPH